MKKRQRKEYTTLETLDISFFDDDINRVIGNLYMIKEKYKDKPELQISAYQEWDSVFISVICRKDETPEEKLARRQLAEREALNAKHMKEIQSLKDEAE